MRYVLFLIIAVIGFSLFGTLLSDYPGTVKVTLVNGSYEMKLAFFVVGLIIFIILGYIAIRLLSLIFHIPQKIKSYGKNNKKEKQTYLLQKGMLAMGRGHWKQAEKLLIKGAKVSESINLDPSLFLSTAAVAAQNLGATARRDHYLLKARQLEVEGVDTVATVLTQARLQLSEGDPEKAVNIISSIKSKNYNNPQLIEIDYEANLAAGNLGQAWHILPLLKKQFVNQELYEKKQKELAVLIFEAHNDRDLIHSVWGQLSKINKKDHAVLLNYVSALMINNEFEAAEKVLVEFIKKDYSSDIIHAYTQLDQGSSAVVKLNQIKKWLKFKPEDSYLNYGAAKFSFQTEQYEEARKYIEHSLKVLPMPESYMLFGQICEALGEESDAFKAYRQASHLTYLDKSKAVDGELLLKDGSNIEKIEDSSNK